MSAMLTADFSIEDALDASARAFDAQLLESTRSAGYMDGARGDGSLVWIECGPDHLLPNHKSYSCDVAAHYTQASCSSFHSSQAAGLRKSTVRGLHSVAHAPLVAPPNTFLATMSDDEMVARLIERQQHHMAEEFMQLRSLYGPPMHDDVAFAVGSPSRTATATNANLIPNPIAALPLAGLASAADDDEVAGLAGEHDVPRKRNRLTADDAIFIYQQKRKKTARMASQLGEEYNVTAKTVRDIWRQRTWSEATRIYSNTGNDGIARALDESCLAPSPSPVASLLSVD